MDGQKVSHGNSTDIDVHHVQLYCNCYHISKYNAYVLFTLFVFAFQNILCSVIVLFFFVLCSLCCQFIWI